MGNQGSQVCTTPNEEIDTLVLEALKRGDRECLNLLLQSGFGVNGFLYANSRVVHFAAKYRSSDCMQLLIKRGADINVPDASGETPLHIAAESGARDCVKLLIKSHAFLECKDNWNRTPLLKAVVNHHYNIASELIHAGASVNAADADKKVPLHVAASYGNSRGVTELLQLGADIDFQDRNGRTALYFAVLSHHDFIVDILIRNNCDVNLRRREGTNALYLAVKKQNLKAMGLLLEAGADTVHIDPRNYQNKDELVRIAIRQLRSQGKPPPDSLEILNLAISAHGLVPGQQLMSSALAQYKKQPSHDIQLVIRRLIMAGGDVKVPDCRPSIATIGFQEQQEAVLKWQTDQGVKSSKNPSSLKNLCGRVIRCSIMYSHAGNIIHGCQNLPIPKALKQIILLERL